MLSNWLFSNKNTASATDKQQSPSYVQENDYLPFLLRRQAQRMVLNADDFRLCFTQALVECGEDAQIADEWYQTDRLFTLQFVEPTLNGTLFEGTTSDAILDTEEKRAEYWRGSRLQHWFREHQNVLERTLAIALDLLKARKAKDQELTEEPEEMFPFWPIFKERTAEHPPQSHTILSADSNERTLLVLTEVDFYKCIVQALAELDQQAVDVEPWIHRGVLYTFAFGNATLSDVSSPPVFMSMTTTGDRANHEDHIIDAKWFSLQQWFEQYPEALQRTFDIALEVVEERSRTQAALGDEGELIDREDADAA